MNRATLTAAVAVAFLFGFILGAAPCSSTPAARSDVPAPLPKPLVFPPEQGQVLVLPLRAVDGDTIEFAILVGQTGRLFGINASELHSADPKEREKGKAAKEYLAKILPDKPCRATLKGKEKYGRCLLVVETDDGKNLAQQMLDAGMARIWDGKGPRP
jgi:endonuclease YncB( thermonuclease family)